MNYRHFIMASALYTLLMGVSLGNSLHCSVRQQIQPCTCHYDLLTGPHLISVTCERMNSFLQVQHALANHFTPATRIKLRITHSDLGDLMLEENPGLGDLNLFVSHLNLSDNSLTTLRAEAFKSMGNITFLNLADNVLRDVPLATLSHMPRLRTLSLGGNRLTVLRDNDLKDLKFLETLILADNDLSEVGSYTLPRRLERLTLARNHLAVLNGSLSDLYALEWLFLNQNRLSTLDGQLPAGGSKLVLMNASHNALRNLPSELRSQISLESLLVDHNEIVSLNGTLQKSRRLVQLSATYNNIEELHEDDFIEAEALTELLLGHNRLKALNGALRPLRSLQRLSLHHNMLLDFDLTDIRGLRHLQELDLRHNHIASLISSAEMQNVVEVDMPCVTELRLGHNKLKELDGFLLGLPGLRSLDLSHNQLQRLPPDELLGLDQLRFLDLSYNRITSLAETAKKILPALDTLLVGHNSLTSLDRELHGLPVLCEVDLSYNQITHVGSGVAAGSACTVRGFPGTLRIYLRGNKLQCNTDLAVTREAAKSSRADLVGLPDCESYLPATPAPLVSTRSNIPEILEVLREVVDTKVMHGEMDKNVVSVIQPEISNLALPILDALHLDEASLKSEELLTDAALQPAVQLPSVEDSDEEDFVIVHSTSMPFTDDIVQE